MEFEYRWIVDGVPRARSVFAPSVAVGADDISDEFEYCEDLSSVAQSGCTVTVPTSVGSIFVEAPSSGTWVFSFGADCAGGSDGPVPPGLVAARIVDFTAATAYRCTIDATEIPDPFPAPDANLTADPTRGDAPLTVTLDASDSTPAEFIADYEFLLVAEVLADDGSPTQADTITFNQTDPVLVTVLPDLGTPTLWRARVRVTDDLVRRNTSAAVDIRVGLNAAPVFAIDDVTVDEGSPPVLLEVSATDPEGDPISYAWDLDGDGAPDSTEPTATFVATENESSTEVEVEVCDDLGACTSDTVQVTVENVAPTVAVEDTPVVGADGSVSFTVSITDPGVVDTHSAVVDWGDGAVDTLASIESGDGLAHTYAGSVIAATVTVTVADDAEPPGVGVVSVDLALSNTVEINTTEDARDTDPGDGICWIGSFLPNGDRACSLRAAVEEANAAPGQQDLLVPSGVYALTSDLFSTDDLTLTGEGRDATRIDGLLWTAPDTSGVVFDLASLTLETPPTDRFAIGSPALTVTSAHLAEVSSFFESLQVGDSRVTSVSLSAAGRNDCLGDRVRARRVDPAGRRLRFIARAHGLDTQGVGGDGFRPDAERFRRARTAASVGVPR